MSSQSINGTRQALCPPRLSQSWQSKWDPAGAACLKAPELIPYLPPLPADPLYNRDVANSSNSKRRCLSRDAMPYGYVEDLAFDFCTAVHIAAYYGHWQVIRQFLDSSQCDPCQLFASRNSQVPHSRCHICLLPLSIVMAPKQGLEAVSSRLGSSMQAPMAMPRVKSSLITCLCLKDRTPKYWQYFIWPCVYQVEYLFARLKVTRHVKHHAVIDQFKGSVSCSK